MEDQREEVCFSINTREMPVLEEKIAKRFLNSLGKRKIFGQPGDKKMDVGKRDLMEECCHEGGCSFEEMEESCP